MFLSKLYFIYCLCGKRKLECAPSHGKQMVRRVTTVYVIIPVNVADCSAAKERGRFLKRCWRTNRAGNEK